MSDAANGTTPGEGQDTSAAGGTILDDAGGTQQTTAQQTTGGEGDTQQTTQQTTTSGTQGTTNPADSWGDNWRQTYANGDAKLQARLERYASPKAVVDALLEAQRKISAGEVRKPLAADAPPEAVAQWREDNGIPQKPEGYFENMPNGVVLGDEDKALFGQFAERMHAKHMPAELMHEVVGWYHDFVDEQATARAERANVSRDQARDVLRDEWGTDFKANLNAVEAFVAPVKDDLLAATMPDGTPLLNSPKLMSWLANQAREVNPIVTLVPNHQNPTQGIEQEIAQIERTMRTDRNAYNKDEKMQARYRQLLGAREKLAKAS